MLVVVAWLVLVGASLPFAQRQADRLTSGGFEAPGSQSARVAQAMSAHFPRVTVEGMALLVEGGPTATAADYLKALTNIQNDVPRKDRVSLSTIAPGSSSEGAEMALSPLARQRMEDLTHGSQRALLPIEVHTSVRQTIDDAVAVFKKLHPERAQRGPVTVRFVGRSVQVAVVHQLSESDAKRSESFAFPLVLIVLIAIFGSLTAALLPVALGASSVVFTGAAIYALSHQLLLSVFVINIASMLGIGVAIDYSLFMLVRYREEVARGADLDSARAIMRRTSGRAVLFAGGTVVLSLLSLFLIKNTILRSMAGGAIIVVAISVVVAMTVLPALIALLGQHTIGQAPALRRVGRGMRALRGRLGARGAERDRGALGAEHNRGGLGAEHDRGALGAEHDAGAPARQGALAPSPFWERWVTRVMARPVLSLALSGALLLGLSAPVLAIKLGTDTLRQLPRDSRTRQAAEIAAKLQGPDAESPVVVTAVYRTAAQALAARASVARIRELMRGERDVASVGEASLSGDHRAYAIMATLHHDPESGAAVETVNRLRSRLARHDVGAGTLSVGGTTATVIDAGDEISGNLWKVIVAVLLLSYVSLLFVLRSAVLPLKAVIMNLLSVGAATGVLVAIFQLGWLSSLLGVESLGHIEIYVPPLVFAVVYGLSMDYEVFLLTRIQERYRASADNRRAVAEGVSSSARTISCAALIMVLVFLAFIATSMPIVQEIGVGSAVAVAIDATLTRLVLLPATMTLLGRWNWWMPRVGRRAAAPAPAAAISEEA